MMTVHSIFPLVTIALGRLQELLIDAMQHS